MRHTWLAAPLLLIALLTFACGDNETNRQLDEARDASVEASDDGEATEGDTATPSEDADEASTDEGDSGEDDDPGTPDASGTEEGDGEINLNIRSPEDGETVTQRRPRIEIFVRNANLRNGDEGVQALVFVDQEPDLTAPPPPDLQTWAREEIRLDRLEDGEHTVWVALIDNTTGDWVPDLEPDSVTFTVDSSGGEASTPTAEPTDAEGGS
jgi:hypothetical protein